MKTQLKIASALMLASALPLAQAGVVEDMLALPAIQSLLGRQPELQAMTQRCTDGRYNQRNARVCQQADAASRLSRIPPELRVVLSYPATAASIRELCLAVQTLPASKTYLCTELYKADVSFQGQVLQQRFATEAAQQKSNQDAQLGK